jgi:cell division transport system permease protein
MERLSSGYRINRAPDDKRIVGEEFFRAMARIHVRQSPPTSPLLFEYGRDFAGLLTDVWIFAIGAIGLNLVTGYAGQVSLCSMTFAGLGAFTIVKLVGASNWYVRLPFLFEGMFAGALGELLAWGLLMASVPRVAGSLREQIQLVPFIGSDEVIAVAPLMLLAGVGIAAVASMVALRRFLDV